MTPLCREGAVEEIVNTVAYLVSFETFIKTGANIDIHDGLALSQINVGVNRYLIFSRQLNLEVDIIVVKKKLI